MPYLIGIVLALAILAFASLVGFDRDRVFYPTLLIVIATYYVLFAVIGGSDRALYLETLITAGFLLVAVVGFRRNLWLVVAGLFVHGVLDFFHGHVVTNPGVPAWWPAFCLTYDVVAAGFLAWLLTRKNQSLQPRAESRAR